MGKQGLFVGLATLDFLYLVTEYPQQNQKVVASDTAVTAGGPATNAAVTFSYLGNEATLLAVLGCHPMAELILADLEGYRIRVADLDPQRSQSPPVSSIIITEGTGDRAVISLNASKSQADSQAIAPHLLQGVDIVLIDGHQMAVSQAIVQNAKQHSIPVVMDGGSWKAGLTELLPFVDYAVCSANFYPPNCYTREDVFATLSAAGIPHIAITAGEQPIDYWNQGTLGTIKVSSIQAIDTLGAGDIFHGAFCHFILQETFVEALKLATKVAAYSCQFLGTRRWMETFKA